MCPVLAGRTRLQIETAIGYNLGALFVGSWTSNTSATVNTDTKIKSPADGSNGKWLHATSGGEAGEIVRVTDDSGAGALTHDALTGTPSSGETYVLWDERYRPDAIHEFINQAVMILYGRAYDPDEYPDVTSSDPATALHGDGSVARFDIPLGFSMIKRLEYRSSFASTSIHSCDAAFDETIDSDITVTADTKTKKQGTASNKFVIAAGAGAGDIATDSITSKNISGYDYIEFWARSTVAAAAGNLKIYLDDAIITTSTIAAGTVLERRDVPALSADTWTFCRVDLAKAELDTAIISVGLAYTTDIGACTIWLDDLKAVKNDEAIWTPVPRRLWHIDKNNRHLILSSAGRSLIGYSMLKIVGGDEPTLMTADANTNEVSDDYVIAKATALAMSAYGPENERTERQIAMWEARASQAYRRLPMLTNVRVVE
jgi:hypothetical protein